MTLSRIAPRTINVVAKAIFADLESFQNSHNALSLSSHPTMLHEGIHVPFHAGAKQYFTANDLLSADGGIPR